MMIFFKWSQLGAHYFLVYLFQHWYFSPIQSEKYQCRTDTINSPDDGHIVAQNM